MNKKDETIVINQDAFIPFSVGPAHCVGKNLAIVEMRMVVSLLIQRFDMRLENSYNPRQWIEDLQDFMVVKTGSLPVIFTTRKD